MKIRTKILLGFILLAVIGLTLGIVGLMSNITLTRMSTELKALQETSRHIVGVLDAHFDWRQILTEAVMEGQEFTGSTDPESCTFATWLKTEEAQTITDPQVLVYFEKIAEPHRYMHTEAKTINALIAAGQREEAQRRLLEDVLPKMWEVTILFGEMERHYIALSDNLSAEIVHIGSRLNILIISLIVIALAACLAIAFILIRWIINKIYWYENILDCIPFPLSITDNNRNWTFVNKSVEDILEVTRTQIMGQPCSNWRAGICDTANCGINCLEQNKKTTTFEQKGMHFQVDTSYLTNNKDKKVGHIEVVQDITTMVKAQMAEAALVQNISQVSQSFIAESAQVSNGAQTMAEGAVQQAASIQELSSAIAAVAAKTKHNAEIAEQAEVLAGAIKGNAEKGNRQMSEMIEAVKQINDASQSIKMVIRTIDDLAFQTNILALNAAVEAARAGQHGRGFAVVADEVRNLATKSAEAAKDTESLIANSMEKSELGVRMAEETATSLGAIMSGIGESSRLITKIAAASEEQARSITKIDTNIEEVAQIMQQNSATAEEDAAAAQEMSKQASLLQELIYRFHERESKAESMSLRP